MSQKSDKPIRVLLTEHQTLVRIGIKTILGAADGFEIVGEAETGAKGFELFGELKPDVTVLSLRTPDSCAIDLLDDYFAENKKAKIIVLADTAGDAEIKKALKKGAAGISAKMFRPKN